MQTSQTIAYALGDNLYLNITDRCTLRCRFCPKMRGVNRIGDHDLHLDHRPEVEEILDALGEHSLDAYREVVFCGYGESTLRLKVLLQVADWLKQRGARVRLNTDGLASLAHRRDVLPEMAGRLDKVSVSMNAQNEGVYNFYCQPQLPGSYPAMLAFLQEAPFHIPDVTASAIRGLEKVDIPACEILARSFGVRFRVRELDRLN